MVKIPVILQVLPELSSGGVERGTIEMTRAIVQAGGKALVASSGGVMVDMVRQAGGTHITLPLKSKNPLRIWRNAQLLKSYVSDHDVSLIHARSRAPAWSAYLAASHSKVPFVTTFHGTYGTDGWGKKKYNAVMTKGSLVIAVSRHIQAHILKYYDIPKSRIRVVHRGVDVEHFSPQQVDQVCMRDLIDQWHLEDIDKPILFFPGRVTRWKGQLVVLDALAKLPHRNFMCLFAGDDDKHPRYVRELHEKVNEHKLELNIRFVPATPHMREAYALSHAVLSPAIKPEAFGRIPIEAQAMSKPIIATDHGGACETVQHNVTGFLVPPNNADMLSKSIEQVLKMPPQEHAAMGMRARTHVSDAFSLEHMQQQTLDIYEEVMRHGARVTKT